MMEKRKKQKEYDLPEDKYDILQEPLILGVKSIFAIKTQFFFKVMF